MGEAWKDIAQSLRTLLGGERGRIDGSLFDTAINNLATLGAVDLNK